MKTTIKKIWFVAFITLGCCHNLPLLSKNIWNFVANGVSLKDERKLNMSHEKLSQISAYENIKAAVCPENKAPWGFLKHLQTGHFVVLNKYGAHLNLQDITDEIIPAQNYLETLIDESLWFLNMGFKSSLKSFRKVAERNMGRKSSRLHQMKFRQKCAEIIPFMRCLAKSFDLSEFLLKAALTEQFKLVHLLLEADVKINKELELHAENNIKQVWSDKYYYYLNGGLVLVSIRLGNLNWNEKLFYGETALEYAVSHNWVDVVDAFIEAGADKDTKNDEGYTPLHYSVFSNYSEIVKMLIASGANLDIQDNYGRTALHLSVSTHHPKIAKKLIDNDADKNVQDDSGSTPLQIAISENSHVIVKMLIESGASKHIEDTSGFTAIDLSKSCSREISRMLNEKNSTKSKKNFKQHMCCIII